MSNDAINWVKTLTGVKAGPKALLIWIADAFNETEGYAWPGDKKLMQWTGMGQRSITRHRGELVAAELLLVEPWRDGDGRTGVFRYYLPKHRPDALPLANLATGEYVEGERDWGPDGTRIVQYAIARSSTTGQSVTQPVANLSATPSIEPKLRTRGASHIDAPLETLELKDVS